jgi:type II secretory pathway pseudopilin PulG
MTRPIGHKSILGNEKGMVLAVTLMLIAVLAILGTTAVTTVTTDIKIAGNYRQSQVALYNAEAGVEQVIAYLRTNTVTYPTSSASPTLITVTCPTGYSFNTSVSINYVAPNQYRFQMTGTGAGNASKTIEAYITNSFSLSYGVDGALAMYGNNPAIAGGGAIDGTDHALPSTSCTGSSCHTAANSGPGPSLPGLFSTETVAVGSTSITGNPAQVLNTSAEAQAKDDQWTAFANSIVASGRYDSTFSSSRTAPKITVLTSDTKVTGNNHYYGIIVVSGTDVEIETAGTMTFEGLIILANGATLTTKGTANTYGSVITCNHSELTVTLNGTPTLMYSTAAIANLSNINAPHLVHKTAWRDVF